MKTSIFKYSVIILLIGLFFNTTTCFSQENIAKNYRMLYKFNTEKQPDNSRLLQVSFIGRNKKDRKDKLPVFEAEIKFFTVLNNEEILLGTAKTNKKGFAELQLPANLKLLTNKNGYIHFKALFESIEAEQERRGTL